MHGGLVVLVCALAAACGGDDGGDEPDTVDAGGIAGAAGSSPAPVAGTTGGGVPAVVPLGDEIAGKACGSATDCGGATCATTIPGAAILPAAAPEGYCTGECELPSDCGSGGTCVGALMGLVRGQCFESCGAETECRDGYFCSTAVTIAGIAVPSTCRPKPETVQLEDDVAGRTCAADTECGGGTCVTMRTTLAGQVALPGGYCSGECLEDTECGAGGVCALTPIEGIAGGCFQACGSDADCTRDGYRCREVGTGMRGCDAFPDPLPDDTVGDACAGDADCGGEPGTCAAALPVAGFGAALGQTTPAPGGYCTQRCADETDCGAGAVCATNALGTGRCYLPCATVTDCREGYACDQRGSSGMAMGDAGAPPPTLVCVPIAMTAPTDAGLTDGG
jgi:hypothetical protein